MKINRILVIAALFLITPGLVHAQEYWFTDNKGSEPKKITLDKDSIEEFITLKNLLEDHPDAGKDKATAIPLPDETFKELNTIISLVKANADNRNKTLAGKTLSDLIDLINGANFLDVKLVLYSAINALYNYIQTNLKSINAADFGSGGKYELPLPIQKLVVSMIPILTLKVPGVSSVVWSSEGNKIAFSSYSSVKIYDLMTKNQKTLGSDYLSPQIAWFPGTKLAVSTSEFMGISTIIIWDTQAEKTLESLKGHADIINSIAWSPDNTKLASASSGDHKVKIWDIATENLKTFKLNNASLVVWRPDGKAIAVASGDMVKILDVATGKELKELKVHTVNSIAWKPDGKAIAVGFIDVKAMNNAIMIWDTTTWTPQTLHGHASTVYSVAWSPDGLKLASGSINNKIDIWNTKTWKVMQNLQGHTDAVRSVEWSPSGEFLASASYDSTIKIWFMHSSLAQAIVALKRIKGFNLNK